MRSYSTLGLAAALALSLPTAAMSCGGQATGANAAPMCGMMKTAATDGKATTAAPHGQAAGGCCCMKMAMQGMDGKQAPDEQSKPQTMPDMPGMEAPKTP